MTDPGHDEPLHDPAEPLGAGPYDDEYDDDGFRVGGWCIDDAADADAAEWLEGDPAPTPIHPAELLPGDVLSDLTDDDTGTEVLRRVLRVEPITHPDDGRAGWLVLCDGIVPPRPGDGYDDADDCGPVLPDYSAAALNLDPAIHRRRLYVGEDGEQPVLMLGYHCPMHLAAVQWVRLTLWTPGDQTPAEYELAAHAVIVAVARPRLETAAADPAADRLTVSTGAVTGITEITMSLDTDPAPLLAFLGADDAGTTAQLAFQAWSRFAPPTPDNPVMYGILALAGARPAEVATPADRSDDDEPTGLSVTWRIDRAAADDPFGGSTALACYTDRAAPAFVTDNPLPFHRREVPKHGGWGALDLPDASAA